MSLFEISKAYKPFNYPFAYDAYLMQRRLSWNPEEICFDTDVYDWNHNLSNGEKNTVTQIMRFFVQGDIDIAKAYIDTYMPMFKAVEVRMMLSQFAAFEALHIHAYSMLLDTIGMPEVEYEAFNEYEVMANKHAYYTKELTTSMNDLEQLALNLATFSAFGEGMQLFSSFAILLSFSRPGHNKLTKMGRVITWSIRDEQLHVTSMIRLFHTLIDENPTIWTDKLKGHIYQTCRDMVELEDKFIDLAFEMGDLKDLSKEDVKQYIRYIADRRLLELHLKPEYGVKVNPLPWIEQMINMDEFVNFFEAEVTEYSSAMMGGEWSDVESKDLFSIANIERFIASR
jgi:ribonucleoside-diphosphate reductase beta chain